jgi:hypothetical protein
VSNLIFPNYHASGWVYTTCCFVIRVSSVTELLNIHVAQALVPEKNCDAAAASLAPAPVPNPFTYQI